MIREEDVRPARRVRLQGIAEREVAEEVGRGAGIACSLERDPVRLTLVAARDRVRDGERDQGEDRGRERRAREELGAVRAPGAAHKPEAGHEEEERPGEPFRDVAPVEMRSLVGRDDR
jgi:hypothetical protein